MQDSVFSTPTSASSPSKSVEQQPITLGTIIDEAKSKIEERVVRMVPEAFHGTTEFCTFRDTLRIQMSAVNTRHQSIVSGLESTNRSADREVERVTRENDELRSKYDELHDALAGVQSLVSNNRNSDASERLNTLIGKVQGWMPKHTPEIVREAA